MLSPGAQFALAGRLKLWINAARQLQDNGIPPDLDLNKDEVEDTWTAALKLDTSGVWFSHIAAMMGKYCQFWRGSASLADCSPNSSATGSVKCIMTGEGSSIFDSVKWVCSADALNDSTHMNAGHYLLRTYRHLVVSASTTVGDITDDHVHAALTYYLNLSPNSIEFHGLTAGKFWKIVPDVLSGSHISTLTGVISAIHRHYHRETPE
ncbi:unnamed protein product [Cuscuta europaea]|nr:unnamed protein product [Cuscuta europaea]